MRTSFVLTIRALAGYAIVLSPLFFMQSAWSDDNDHDKVRKLPQFLIVDYHPISKTLVSGNTNNKPLYDYTYRVDVRNSGSAVADLTAEVTSKHKAQQIIQGQVHFGALAAKRTQTSTDTFTVRANCRFDLRLDPKGATHNKIPCGEGDKDDHDEDESNFYKLFDWKFQVRVNTAVPLISSTLPVGIINQSSPSISATFQDAGGGIDPASATLSIDGSNVSSLVTFRNTGFSYIPAPLTNGSHQIVVTVPNNAGIYAQANWSFTTDTAAPVISAMAPKDISTANPLVPIGAQYSDIGVGIDPASVKLNVDGIDVTAQSSQTTSGISFTPSNKLSPGNHTVALTLADHAGNTSTANWSFKIDLSGPVVTALQPANNTELAADAIPTISARVADPLATVNASSLNLEIDGQNVTALAQINAQTSSTQISYTPATSLIEGSHTVKLTVADQYGNITVTTWSFITRTPPVIGTVSPKDITLNAQAPATITAQYSDIGAGVDISKTVLLLDTVDVTSQAQSTAAGLTLTTPTVLPQGVHIVNLTITDNAGNTASTSWRFTVYTGLPVISNMTPQDTILASGTPTISAQYQDSGDPNIAPGIDTASVRLTVDTIDVTVNAQVTETGISYSPVLALKDGLHTIKLSITDKASNTVDATWSFITDTGKPTVAAGFLPAEGTVMLADAIPTISAQYAEVITGIDTANIVLEIDTINVTALAQVTDTGITYTTAAPLNEGIHQVKLTVPNKVGTAAVQTWSFKTATAPEIFEFSPGEGFVFPSGSGVGISFKYRDVGAGVDATSVKLIVDGIDVTLQATISETETLFQQIDAYSTGAHTINFSLADKAGNTTSKEWSFEMDGPATTVISNFRPVQYIGLPYGTNPVISADFADPVGIDVAHTRVIIDDVDVTSMASVTASGFSYQSAVPLAEGRHSVYLRVSNMQGRDATALWSFDIDSATAYNMRFTEPVAGKGYLKPLADVIVVASSDKATVSGITLNGSPMSYVSSNGLEVTYTGQAALVLGENILKAVATYSDNRTKEASISVNYDFAPTITITAPLDRTTLGPVVNNSPRDLTGNVERPVTITGLTNKPVQSVTINQQAATLSGDGNEFSFPSFFLREGNNLLTAVATDAQGRIGTASLTVSVDQTAPFLAVEAPLNNSVTSGNSIDVRGTVNDAVEGYFASKEPTVTITSAKSSSTAQVSDRQFFAAAVPLELGENTLTVTATDEAGNARNTQIKVIRVAASSQRLIIYAGNAQSTTVGTALSKPLTVAALDQDGRPLANTSITFDITRGTGSLSKTQEEQISKTSFDRNRVIITDDNGLASVWLTLGKQSGPGSNAVHASATNIAEDVTFIVSGERGPPKFIRADLGINQYVATGSQSLEPLTAVVMDDQENRIPNAAVIFSVVEGDAMFENGSNTITTNTDKNGYAVTRPVVGAKPGKVIVKASPEENPDNFFEATFTLQALEAKDGPTQFSGVVMNDKGQPLPGARMSIGRTALSTTVDDNGHFAFDDVPPGKIDLFVDGRTVNLSGQQYPALHFEATAVKGAANQLPHPIYLPQLQMAEAKIVGGDQDVILQMPGFEGYEMTVFANSVTFPDGSKTGPLVVSPISLDKLPMSPPGGYAGFMAPAATLQPSGTRFDPPVRLKLPNSAGFKPGEKKPVYQWDHDLATFVQMGQATVTEDGAFLITDPGTGISKAGWHPIPNPPPPEDCPEGGGAPSCDQCNVLKAGNGKCPHLHCEPDTSSFATSPYGCDDGLYCTLKDKCVGGSCIGEPIEDTPETPLVLTTEVNLAVLNEGYRILSLLGLTRSSTGGETAFKLTLETSSQTHCCESEKKFTTIKKQKLEGKLNLGFGPSTIPGVFGGHFPLPSFACWSPGCTLDVGLLGSADFGASAGFEKKATNCSDDKPCWQGSGKLSLEIGVDGGAILKNGPITIARATIGAKSGFDAGLIANCDTGQVAGGYFQGLKAQVILEFFDGGVHYDLNWELLPGYAIPGVSFDLPQ
jgi:hypothetical protein